MTDVEILRGETLKVGDTRPKFRAKLVEDGNPFNLTGYDVKVHIKRSSEDGLLVDDLVTVESANRGIVTYAWENGETSNKGTYEAEFVASNERDEITFPNGKNAKLYIQPRLG